MEVSNINVWVAVIAAYAAIVATGALALEVRRWVEARARLVLSLSQDMAFSHDTDPDASYVIASATNRGTLPTTITHLSFEEYGDWWKAWRRKRTGLAMVVAIPTLAGMPQNLPSIIGPGEKWDGMAKQTDKFVEWAKKGRVYVVIYVSHRNKSYIRRIVWRERPDG